MIPSYEEGMKVLNEIFERVVPKSTVQTVKFSYLPRAATFLYKKDRGCFNPFRKRANTDYFLTMMKSEHDSSIFHYHSHTTDELQLGETAYAEKEKEMKQSEGIGCQYTVSFLPRNLQHIVIDNISDSKSYFCARLRPNILRFLNLSDNAAFGPELNGVVYGLGQLQVVDFSQSRYRKLNPQLLEHLLSQTHL